MVSHQSVHIWYVSIQSRMFGYAVMVYRASDEHQTSGCTWSNITFAPQASSNHYTLCKDKKEEKYTSSGI